MSGPLLFPQLVGPCLLPSSSRRIDIEQWKKCSTWLPVCTVCVLLSYCDGCWHVCWQCFVLKSAFVCTCTCNVCMYVYTVAHVDRTSNSWNFQVELLESNSATACNLVHTIFWVSEMSFVEWRTESLPDLIQTDLNLDLWTMTPHRYQYQTDSLLVLYISG